LQYPIKIVKQSGVDVILDHIRKKYVLLTPEEMVRQYTLKIVVENHHYPKACIAVEKRIKINQRFMRFDILIYNDTQPWMLVECKASHIPITQDTLMQSLAYHHKMAVQYILLTNGEDLLCLDVMQNTWLQQLPNYPINP
jgi:hypothetical protein